jgi:hypothetical protein
MKLTKILLSLSASLLAAILLSGAGLAQGTGPGQAPAPQVRQGTPKITVIGKIAYLEAEGGYYIQGEKPHELFIIANQDPNILGKLAQTGETVTIEARTMGDILTIETINGKPYQGSQKPVFK